MDKNEFFEATKIETGSVVVKGYGKVPVRSLTLQERVQLVPKYKEDEAAATLWVVMKGLDFSEEDRPRVELMNPVVIEQITAEVLRLTGIEPGDDGEDVVKNV